MKRLSLVLCLAMLTAMTYGRPFKVDRSLSDQLAVHYIAMARLLIDEYPSIAEKDRRDATRLYYNHLFTIWLQTESRFKVFSSDWEAKDLLRKTIVEAILKYADLADPLEISPAYNEGGILRKNAIVLLPYPLEERDVESKKLYQDLVDEFRAYIDIQKK